MFSNQFAYVNTKLRSRLSKCLTDEQLESLIKAPSISEAVLLLRGTYYEAYDKAYEEAGDLRLAELAIAREEINLFKGLTVGCSNEESHFIKALVMKFEIENLKILISTWFNKVIFKQRIVINDNLFLREKILNDIPYDDIINAGDFGALAAALGRTVYGPVIEGVLESKSLFQIGVALDRYYYHALYMSSNMLPGNSRLMARRFFGTTVDFENLICQLRYRRMRFNASNNYNEYFIEGGRLVTVNNIDEVTANEASVKTFLENTFSGSYSERGEEGGDIIELVEHTRNEELYHIARAFLAMQPDSIATLIAYFLIMHREHMQVITVLQSHYYNLDEEKTREALCL